MNRDTTMKRGQWQVANLLHLVYEVVAVPLYGKIHMAEDEDRAMADVPVNLLMSPKPYFCFGISCVDTEEAQQFYASVRRHRVFQQAGKLAEDQDQRIKNPVKRDLGPRASS